MDARPYSHVIETLRGASLRPTRQRIALAKLLFDDGHRHVTAESLHADAQEAAAFALWSLAGDSKNRVLITESGGIGPLVLLLGCSNPKAREHAEAGLVRTRVCAGKCGRA